MYFIANRSIGSSRGKQYLHTHINKLYTYSFAYGFSKREKTDLEDTGKFKGSATVNNTYLEL